MTGLFYFMNIRVILSDVAGSSEATIEQIERCVVKKQPFGLKCFRSAIVFIPHTFKAYWVWSDGSPGPIFETKSLSEFVDCIKMQYLSHKELINTDELLGIAEILKHEQQQKRLGFLPRQILPEPGQSAGPVDPGPGRIITGEDGRN
jgi:hypothetical protein